MLFALSKYRDIIVHNTFDQLSNEKIEKVVKKDCYEFCESFAKEIKTEIFTPSKNVIEQHDEIVKRENFNQRMKDKVEHHKSVYELKKQKGLLTKIVIDEKSCKSDETYIVCPVCNNKALLSVDIDYDYDEFCPSINSIVPKRLKCEFCDLDISDFDEFDYFDIRH
jgi:hypothetical protein